MYLIPIKTRGKVPANLPISFDSGFLFCEPQMAKATQTVAKKVIQTM
jgi:hypothetical protein